MEAVEQLLELEALKMLKARYFYYMDTKQWNSWLDLFGPKATLKWDSAASNNVAERQTSAVFTGRKELEDAVINGNLDFALTIHHGHTPILEILTPSSARGIWAMEDIVTTAQGTLHGFGHYHETYEKLDGRLEIRFSPPDAIARHDVGFWRWLKSTVRVSVKTDICQGHSMCIIACNKVFTIDESTGHASVLMEVVPIQWEAAVRVAQTSCPEGAIELT